LRAREIELFYTNGTRALENDLDVGDWISNDVLALHKIAFLPEYRGRQYGLHVMRMIIERACQCALNLKNSPYV
jgi:ribosomal protein S18 acetylase RimI-like enzyme